MVGTIPLLIDISPTPRNGSGVSVERKRLATRHCKIPCGNLLLEQTHLPLLSFEAVLAFVEFAYLLKLPNLNILLVVGLIHDFAFNSTSQYSGILDGFTLCETARDC